MGEIQRIFVPFGEFTPDQKDFSNEGLVECRNVVPVYGSYIASPSWEAKTNALAAEPYGLQVLAVGGSTYWIHYGDATKLYQVNPAAGPPWTVTDKSRLVGGAYGTAGAGGENGWQSTSFGDAVVMTNYVDDPQILVTPGTANFAKLAQSGGANPGMDPKAKFAWAHRGNLMLANLNLAAPFDTLAAGANPTVICWSQSDNIRQFGSPRVTPQLIGSSFQPLNYDLGHITGGGGGEYSLVAMQFGWVRLDGAGVNVEARPIVRGTGCRFPNSIVNFDGDWYFWGPGGPTALYGGEGPPVVLGDGKVVRTLIDNETGFSTDAISVGAPIRHVSTTIDPVNRLVVFSVAVAAGSLIVFYSLVEKRFSFSYIQDAVPVVPEAWFLRQRPELGESWLPGRSVVAALNSFPAGAVLGVLKFGAFGSTVSLGRAYQQFDPDRTQRIRRVRPVYSMADAGASLTVSAEVSSKNKPFETVAPATFSFMDEHGWIATPDTRFADFHRVLFSFAQNGLVVPSWANEFKGYEAEVEMGGRHSA